MQEYVMMGYVFPEYLEHREMIGQVKQGMELLDRDRPGWEDLIWIDVLDLASSCGCILGQVYAQVYEDGFVGAVRHLFGIEWTRDVSDSDYQKLVDHGFATEIDYQQLRMVWVVLLQEEKGVGHGENS